jgi:hypothetical protein
MRSHDQLADSLEWDVPLFAVFVQHLLTVHAQLSLERAFRVIETGVNHFGIAAARMHADFGLGLEYDDLAPGLRERATDSESDDTCANYDAIQLISHS